MPQSKVGQILHKQSTGLSKDISRRFRVDRAIDYTDDPLGDDGKLAVDVIISNTLPTKRSKSKTASNMTSGHDDSVSLVAKQFDMHLKNQKKIKSLMALLGKPQDGGRYAQY